jgi:hypothetical protein
VSRIITLSGRSTAPVAPYEISDEVQRWAQRSGRNATLHFVPTLLRGRRVTSGTWMARLSLKPNDPRMERYQQGLAERPPTEDIWFHRTPTPTEIAAGRRPNDYIPLDIQQMGVSGVREFLEKGDMWSGRGEYASLEEQVRKVNAANETAKEAFREHHKTESRLEQKDKRRSRFKIPFLRVGIDLPKE